MGPIQVLDPTCTRLGPLRGTAESTGQSQYQSLGPTTSLAQITEPVMNEVDSKSASSDTVSCLLAYGAEVDKVCNDADMGKRLKDSQKQGLSTVVVDRIRRRLRQNGFRCHITLQVSSLSCFNILIVRHCGHLD